MTERRTSLRAAVLVIALLAAGVFAAQAQAATYTVNTTTDNAATANECAGQPGDCSLRQAIDKANSSATPSTIVVPAGNYDLGLNGSSGSGALTIQQSMTITGAGARTTTVQQFSATPDRVFLILIPPSAGPPTPPTVTISGLTISGGIAPTSGAHAFFGGDIQNQGTLTLSEDWITGGQASSGGGVSNDGGVLTVTHSLISGNTANAGGADSGGIQNFGPNPVTNTAGTLEVDNSTIAGNTAHLSGGIASGGDAGNTVSIVNSTIAYNDGGTRADLPNAGGLVVDQGSASVQNSIIAFNTIDAPNAGTPANCATYPAGNGTITSSGYNIESGTDCGLTSTGDRQKADPKFTSAGPQNNGGNTNTLGLSAGSPAVDAIPYNDGAPCDRTTDQRDLRRPEGLGCDIGAYELIPTITASEGGPAFSGQLAPIPCGIVAMTVDWGDGNKTPGDTATGVGSHTYSEDGTYSGVISWTDDCGAHTSMFQAQVADAPLTNGTGSPVNANAGQAFSGPVATFNDADPAGTTSDYVATINWGDGTTSPGSVSGSGPFTVNGTHTYAAGGPFPVTVTITDAGGSTTTATGNASVTPQSQPALTPSAPSVISTTSAAFVTNVNPDGLVTNVVFQYGPTLAGAGDVSHALALAASPTYTSTTPAQAIGPDYSNHTVAATVTGLLPNTTYHVRAVATNSAGTTTGPDQTLTTPADPPPPAPTLGKTFNLVPVSGVVLIKLNNVLVPLTEVRQIPANTQIDALQGTIQLVTAGGTAHTASSKGQKTQTGNFGGAIFTVSQARSGKSKGQTTLSIVEGAFPGAPTYASCKAKKASDSSSAFVHAAGVSSKVLQTLRASAHGHFRTRGRYAAATVRGTAWTTTDRCDGTLISVQVHSVLVTDFVRHKTIAVRAGHSYLARAKPTKK